MELTRIDGAGFRIIAAKVAGVDYNAPHNPRHPETNDTPVVARIATTACLPTIHPFPALCVKTFAPLGSGGLEKILLGSKEFIICRDHSAAHSLGSEVYEVGEHEKGRREERGREA